jgi:hypothetical protein
MLCQPAAVAASVATADNHASIGKPWNPLRQGKRVWQSLWVFKPVPIDERGVLSKPATSAEAVQLLAEDGPASQTDPTGSFRIG